MDSGHGAAVTGLVPYAGPCWRAIAVGQEAQVLDGSDRAARYNRPGERALYMSGSAVGVAAAMARYGDAERVLVRLDVTAGRLLDVRDAAACRVLGVDATLTKVDWLAALERGEEPPSWRVSDRARAVGAQGLIERSRRTPTEWHLVLFRWNEQDGGAVRVAGPTRK